LWSIGPAAEATLKKARESGDAEVRAIAALALQAVGPKANTTLESAIADEQIDLGIRRWALTSLPWDSPQLPTMKKALGYSDPKLRSLAAYALGTMGPKPASAVPALTRLLRDESEDVRRAAVYALGEMGPEAKSAIPELVKMLHRWMKEDETRHEEAPRAPEIVLALWKIGPDAIPALVQALRTVKDEDTADEIIASLGLLGSAAVSPLQEVLEDQDPKVRVRAAWALAVMGTEAQSAVPAMQQAVRNAAPDDKIHLLGALAEILPDSLYGRQVKQRVQQLWKLKQVGLAMQNYHDTFRRFPLAAWSKDGKPLLSWRVALLPYLEQAALYDKFHLDEPWDSPHNIKLLAMMPYVYNCGGRREEGKTSMMVFTGEGTAFHGTNALKESQIRDGTDRTIMVVVTGPDKAVPWTKPEDLPFDPQDPSAAMGEVPEVGFPAVLFDASTHILPKAIDAKRLRALITPNGGEDVDLYED
jgi:HEAT repeat protein